MYDTSRDLHNTGLLFISTALHISRFAKWVDLMLSGLATKEKYK